MPAILPGDRRVRHGNNGTRSAKAIWKYDRYIALQLWPGPRGGSDASCDTGRPANFIVHD